MSLRRLSRPLGSALSGLLATAALALVPATAHASVQAPTGLAPSGPTSSNTPTFTWNRVSGATQYELVITAGSNQLVQTSTVNNKYVLTRIIPSGPVSWQVRADTPSGNSAWSSATATISATGAPSPIAPVGGTVLTQPDNPPLFSWSPVTGAVGYEVQVDNTGTFTSPVGDYFPSGTSYFVSTPQAPGTWNWRVRANLGNGLYTSWSSAASYEVGQLDDPTPGDDMTGTVVMQDVSIDWKPVPGAMEYQLQVGRDPDFNNLVDDQIVVGTRFQPNLTYNNDQYYWRVRAIDAAGNRMPWTSDAPFSFQRNWPQAPQLEWPPNQLVPAVSDPLYFQWKPVPHATSYQLDISGDPNFSPGQYFTCTTTGTTYLIGSPPSGPNSCGALSQGQTLYWRVRAIDGPQGIQGIYSSINKFVYDTGRVAQTSPTDGATVDVPTLTWNPVRESNQYEVVVRNKNSQIVASTDTFSTSWTPESKLIPTDGPFTWNVVSIDASGGKSPLYSGMTFNLSGNDPTSAQDPLTQLTGTSTSTDFPDLTWVPVSGAAYYVVTLGVHGSNFMDLPNTSHINGTHYPYPAATDTLTHYLTPGSYDWYVTAYDDHDVPLLSSSALATFTIGDLPAASGQQVALDGTASQDGAGCTKSLSAAQPSQQICTGVPSTPTLSWNSIPGAAGYMVYLANDRELTNLVTDVAVTTNTMWRPPSELPDNTAQGSYYWYVRPCKSLSPVLCSPDPTSMASAATNAFRKQSPAVALQTPANGSTVTGSPANASLFTWTDYLTTNQAPANAFDGVGEDPSYESARTYRIQISQSPNFSSVLDDRELDQPFYSPSGGTLPQGTIYWRVQALDGSANHLTWSSTFSFSNNQPAVDLSAAGAVPSPVGGVTVAGSTPFRWAPRNGAQSYRIEVYANDDATHSPANLVFADNTAEPAYVWQSYLPPSTSAYRWRVSWTDAGQRSRPFSADGRFFVTASSVTLKTPTTGTFQKSNDVYYSWNPVPLAATYRIEVKDQNGNTGSVETAATAYAPSGVSDGIYQWRVVALDPSHGAIATSAWRTFTVDATAPVITAVSPTSTGKPTSHVKLTFSEKVTGVTTTSFQLLQSGRKTKLPAKVKLASNGRSATLTPKAKLKKGKTYTVKVTTAVHDAAGNHLAAYVGSFQVQ